MSKRLLITLLLFFGIQLYALAQGCGPNCPVCSGSANGNLTSAQTFSIGGLYIPSGEEETGVMTVRYGAFDWLDVGIGYTFKEKNIIWNARIKAINQDEDSWKPALILGTGSIRADGNDQSIYMSLLKSKEFSESFAISVSAGIATLSSDMSKYYGIANLSLIFHEKLTAFVNFDGLQFHEGIQWTFNDWLSAGFMLIETKDPAISINIRGSLFK